MIAIFQVSGEGGNARLYKNSIHCAKTIIRTEGKGIKWTRERLKTVHRSLIEGIIGLYNGLSASLARQLSYTTVRLGTYNVLLDAFSSENQPPSFIVKVGLGLTAGTIGAICGTPADVALVRMCVDNRLPQSQRRNYKRPGFLGIDVRPVSDHTIRP